MDHLDYAQKRDVENLEQALRYNQGKIQWDLVHFPSIEPMVKVLEFGMKKYSKDNWKKGLPKDQLLESAMRHLVALFNREDNDKESGINHAAHVMCNMMFYNYFYGGTGSLETGK